MTSKLSPILHLDFGHVKLGAFIRGTEQLLKEGFGEFRNNVVVSAGGDGLDGGQHGVVQLLHARCLLQQLHLGLGKSKDRAGVANLQILFVAVAAGRAPRWGRMILGGGHRGSGDD